MKKFMCVAMAMFVSITSAYAAELNVVYNPNTGLYDVIGNAYVADICRSCNLYCRIFHNPWNSSGIQIKVPR